eukprot:7714376-Pyramimonas_sp.AAC.1
MTTRSMFSKLVSSSARFATSSVWAAARVAAATAAARGGTRQVVFLAVGADCALEDPAPAPALVANPAR